MSLGRCQSLVKLQSICYYVAVATVMKWFPGRTGLTGSVCIAGFGFGAVIWIPLETAFVNPDNVVPVEVEGVEDDK